MLILTPSEIEERDLRLRPQGVFAGISAANLADLEEEGVYVEFEKEHVACDQEPLNYFFYIVHGGFSVTKLIPQTGEEKQLATVFAGQCFGEMSYLLEAPASANVLATDKVVTWTIPHDALRQFIQSHEDGGLLVSNIAALLAQRLVQANLRIAK